MKNNMEVSELFNECNFIPQGDNFGSIKYYHFVYEANLRKLKQPFVHSMYYMYLVTKGTAILKVKGKEYTLEPGTVFFTFPWQKHEIIDVDDVVYMYISFNGTGVSSRFASIGIDEQHFIYPNFGHVLNYWTNSIRRFSKANANILTESVLMYTLSFINNHTDLETHSDDDRFKKIIEYIETNYTDRDISLKNLADIFFYSEKYLSALFIKRTEVKFTDYLNKLRIDYAVSLLEKNKIPLSKVSEKCGFTDPFYFSKVFKKITGKTPTEYKKLYRAVAK